MSLAYANALLRRFPRSYTDYYVARGRSISLEDAARQHDSYAAALHAAGLEIEILDGAEETPDSVFIEDTAVLWGRHALRTRPRPPRTPETDAVAARLRLTHEVTELPEGAFLEGGDVFSTESATFVGLSSRTNRAGAESLSRFMKRLGRETIAVPIEKCFHLKSAITYLGDNTVAIAPDLVDAAYFARFEQIHIDADEAHGANCVRAGDHLLVSALYPKAVRTLTRFAEQRGLTLHTIDNSEFAKGDGALTCLSLLWS